jgi:glutamate synthase domain-containing protein 1
MCGIAGLFLKDKKLEPELGTMLAGMVEALADRGPDSTGFAIYGSETKGSLKFTLCLDQNIDPKRFIQEMKASLKADLSHSVHGNHLVLIAPSKAKEAVEKYLSTLPGVEIVGSGQRMEIYKEVGRPEFVTSYFGLRGMSGTHAIGHTRMATESAVTTNGAHPFTAGLDQCLVHNGSLSNHNAVRRDLIRNNLKFQTENDSEVAAGYLTWRMQEGLSLKGALESSLTALDGFYTFVVGTESGFGVLRDPVACKPAVMAETEKLVAFGTEYRALVDLPGIDSAKVWEPEPAKVYLWERH